MHPRTSREFEESQALVAKQDHVPGARSAQLDADGALHREGDIVTVLLCP